MSDHETDPATQAILDLPRDRVYREAVRAHEALLRYGQHDDDCPQADAGPGPCDCGLDAACYSPFTDEPADARALRDNRFIKKPLNVVWPCPYGPHHFAGATEGETYAHMDDCPHVHAALDGTDQ